MDLRGKKNTAEVGFAWAGHFAPVSACTCAIAHVSMKNLDPRLKTEALDKLTLTLAFFWLDLGIEFCIIWSVLPNYKKITL